jgi:hypothetical protein
MTVYNETMLDLNDIEQPKVGRVSRRLRRQIYYSALLHIRELTIRCRVRNVSATGMLIETTVPLWSGAPCHIALPKIGDVYGVVMWSDGPHAGMKLDIELQDNQLAKLGAPAQSTRVATQCIDTVYPKTKSLKIKNDAITDRARSAVSWLRSK